MAEDDRSPVRRRGGVGAKAGNSGVGHGGSAPAARRTGRKGGEYTHITQEMLKEGGFFDMPIQVGKGAGSRRQVLRSLAKPGCPWVQRVQTLLPATLAPPGRCSTPRRLRRCSSPHSMSRSQCPSAIEAPRMPCPGCSLTGHQGDANFLQRSAGCHQSLVAWFM